MSKVQYPNQPNYLLKSSLGTKLAYGVGDLGINFLGSLAAGFLTMYYVDNVGLAAATVGTLMLICSLCDGVTDLIVGALLEKTNTKWGKARPWFVFGIIPFIICMVMIFNVPQNFSDGGKLAFAYFTYLFAYIVCFTVTNLSYAALLSRFTNDSNDRNLASALRLVFAMGGMLLVNMITIPLLTQFGGVKNQDAWRQLVLIYAAISFVILTLPAVFVKERKEFIAEGQADRTREKGGIKRSLAAVLTSKYFYIVLGLFLCMGGHGGLMGLAVYYARDVLGNADLTGLLSAATLLPTILSQSFVPALVKKLGKRRIIICAAAVVIASSILLFISPRSISMVMVCFILRGIGMAPVMGTLYTFPADLVDFLVWKKKIHTEGVSYSTTTLGQKLGIGLGAAVVGWGLSLGKYDPNIAVQAAATTNTMIGIMGGAYLVIGAGFLLMAYFWDFETHLPDIQAGKLEKVKQIGDTGDRKEERRI
jgi:GPH family glycoside/pentoside/hexuronide:cation symporter